MSRKFENLSLFSDVHHHSSLPIIKTKEFNFFRSVFVEDWIYNTTVSDLHRGNLRINDKKGRHSKLFPGQKISYWAGTSETALKEIKRHGANKNYITFWAYDDATSFMPTISVLTPLAIVDGNSLGFDTILDKIENDIELTSNERKYVDLIAQEKPDCLAYTSIANRSDTNYLFFEKGFQKLSIKNVKFTFGENEKDDINIIHCASGSDYIPILENYGDYFASPTEIKTDKGYTETDEYKRRKANKKMNNNYYH